MSDILDNWQPVVKAEEAEAVLLFVARYYEIHRKPPTLRQTCDGTKLNEYRAKRAIARLRRQNLLSQTSLRPMQKAIQSRLMKQAGSAGE